MPQKMRTLVSPRDPKSAHLTEYKRYCDTADYVVIMQSIESAL